jgi:hypothetical protein
LAGVKDVAKFSSAQGLVEFFVAGTGDVAGGVSGQGATDFIGVLGLRAVGGHGGRSIAFYIIAYDWERMAKFDMGYDIVCCLEEDFHVG